MGGVGLFLSHIYLRKNQYLKKTCFPRLFEALSSIVSVSDCSSLEMISVFKGNTHGRCLKKINGQGSCCWCLPCSTLALVPNNGNKNRHCSFGVGTGDMIQCKSDTWLSFSYTGTPSFKKQTLVTSWILCFVLPWCWADGASMYFFHV